MQQAMRCPYRPSFISVPLLRGPPVEVHPVDPEKGLGLSHLYPTLFFLSLCSSLRTPHTPAVVQPTLNAFKFIHQKHGAFTQVELPGNGAGLLSERLLACVGSCQGTTGQRGPAAALRPQLCWGRRGALWLTARRDPRCPSKPSPSHVALENPQVDWKCDASVVGTH